MLGPLDQLAALLAAAVHDYAHPGLTNAFLVASHHECAAPRLSASPARSASDWPASPPELALSRLASPPLPLISPRSRPISAATPCCTTTSPCSRCTTSRARGACCSLLKVPSTLPEDTAPSASLGHLEAPAATKHPRAPLSSSGARRGLRSPPQAAPKLGLLHLPPAGAAHLARLRPHRALLARPVRAGPLHTSSRNLQRTTRRGSLRASRCLPPPPPFPFCGQLREAMVSMVLASAPLTTKRPLELPAR